MTALKWNGYASIAVNFCTGCSNQFACRTTCWARAMARRLAAIGNAPGPAFYTGLVGAFGGNRTQGNHQAGLPYARQLARRGDAFHPALHLDVMARWDAKLARMKTGKRIALNFMSDICSVEDWDVYGEDGMGMAQSGSYYMQREYVAAFCTRHPRHTFLILTKRPEELFSPWPANVHVGVSASTVEELNQRWPHLLKVDCGLRWISLEPWNDDILADGPAISPSPGWVVIGRWSGKRPLRPEVVESAQSIVRACRALGVPVFVKDNLRYLNLGCVGSGENWPQEIPA